MQRRRTKAECEVIGSVTLPSYRGDLINSIDFDELSRSHDPNRMLQGYHSAAATMNLIRAFASGGLADLSRTRRWLLPSNRSSKYLADFQNVIERAQGVVASVNGNVAKKPPQFDTRRTEIYTSHEALLLPYEQALTREDSFSGGHFLCSTHFQPRALKKCSHESRRGLCSDDRLDISGPERLHVGVESGTEQRRIQ